MLWQDPATAAGAHSRAWRVLREPRAQAIAARLGIGEADDGARCASAATPPRPGPRGAALPDLRRRRLRELPRRRGRRLACQPLCGRRHPRRQRRARHGAARQSARARRALPRLPFRQRRPGPVRHPPDHGRRPPADQLRARPLLDAAAALRCRRAIMPRARAAPIRRADLGDRPGDGARPRARRCSPPARGTEGMFPEFYFFDCHYLPPPDFRRSALPSRRAVANPGRPIPAGMPPFNDENMIMLVGGGAGGRAAARGSGSSATAAPSTPRSPATAPPPIAAAGTAAGERAGRSPTPSPRAVSAGTQTFAIIDTITGKAIATRFTDYAGSVQAVMATDTLLSALVNRARSAAGAAASIRADINARLSRGPRSQCLRPARIPGQPRPRGGAPSEG